MLEAAGVTLELEPEQVAICIEKVGIGFMFAPIFHPAMKHAIVPRRELKQRTIFNILGPLTNPAGAAHQLTGVYDAELTEPIAYVLGELGCKSAMVIHSHDGLDELTTIGPNRISHLRPGGTVHTFELEAKDLGIENKQPESMTGGSIEKNLVRPYEQNLDTFPYPDWSIYPETAFYKPFKGHAYKYGDFEMSRGCPYKCSYCINVQLQAIYKPTGENFHREKSIKRVIDEIKSAREKYDIEFLKFWDETFLLMSKERLEEFTDIYSEQIGLPYVIETTSQSITPFTAKLLKKSNCKSASLGLETGNPDIRNGLLHKPTDNDTYIKAFKLLEENGIQKVSFNMLGLPFEKEEDVFKTIAMNRLCKTDVQAIGNFYPYKGTPIRRMLKEEGLLNEEAEREILSGYDFTTLTANDKSVIRFKDMNYNIISKITPLFANYTTWPVILWPLIDLIKNEENNGEFTKLLCSKINAITYFKKFKIPTHRTGKSTYAIGHC